MAALLLLCIAALAQPTPAWRITRSEHFELYSQGDDASSRAALVWLEQLRAFYLQKTGMAAESLHPVRVISFRSAGDYQPYRLRLASNAHYIGTESLDYIVMAALDAGAFPTAAHEYAHSILHAAGLKFPTWFAEGLAEFFSTVSLSERECRLGGDLPARSQTLRRQTWMPLADVLDLPANSAVLDQRETAILFYAESWALTDMLVLAPQYSARFPELIAALSSGTSASQALPGIYGKSLDAIASDLRAWAAIKHQPVPLPGIQGRTLPQNIAVETSVDVPLPQARAVLAEMLLAAGELERAATIYTELARESPRDAGAYAALGAIAVGQGDRQRALEQWKLAIALGIQDARLCYQYALLGEQAGIPEEELRPALERAIALKPGFDDARYLLAIMERNAGEYAAALVQLRAMRTVPPARAYNYWLTMADAFLQLDRREDARNASTRAMEYAATAAEHDRAAQLAYLAETDFAVQYAIGQNGRPELRSTRVPHATADFNPFIEPGDKIRHVAGALLAIDCSGDVTRFVVATSEGRLTLAIPDPGHVQMRNAPSEFTCGPQKSTNVVVDYAVVDYAVVDSTEARANGLVRGMQFTEPRP